MDKTIHVNELHKRATQCDAVGLGYHADAFRRAADRIEELEATVRGLGNAHHDEIETRTKNTELQSRIEALEATLRYYLENADTRMVKGFNFIKGEYPVTSETIAILCKEKADLEQRIEELEADKASLEEKLSLYLGGWPSLEQRIEELEAELIEAKCCLVKRERYHKAKLNRVEELEQVLIEAERDWEEERRKVRNLEAGVVAIKREADRYGSITWISGLANLLLDKENLHFLEED